MVWRAYKWCTDPDCCAGSWHFLKLCKTERSATTVAEKALGRPIYGWTAKGDELICGQVKLKKSVY